jgi:hypothetical protein
MRSRNNRESTKYAAYGQSTKYEELSTKEEGESEREKLFLSALGEQLPAAEVLRDIEITIIPN